MSSAKGVERVRRIKKLGIRERVGRTVRSSDVWRIPRRGTRGGDGRGRYRSRSSNHRYNTRRIAHCRRECCNNSGCCGLRVGLLLLLWRTRYLVLGVIGYGIALIEDVGSTRNEESVVRIRS